MLPKVCICKMLHLLKWSHEVSLCKAYLVNLHFPFCLVFFRFPCTQMDVLRVFSCLFSGLFKDTELRYKVEALLSTSKR